MRIAIVIDDFFPASGGIARSVQTQMEELIYLGHEPVLIAPKYNLAAPDDVEIITIPAYYIKGLPSHCCILKSSKQLASKISLDQKFDIVHSQTDRGAVALAAQISKAQGIPHIHTFHANIAGSHSTAPIAAFLASLFYIGFASRLKFIAKKQRQSITRLQNRSSIDEQFMSRVDWRSLAKIASEVDAFTSPSRFMAKNILKSLDQPVDNYFVPTGINRTIASRIDKAARRRESDKIRFITVGRLSKEKRTDVIIKAFKKSKLQNAELVIVGDGDQKSALKLLARGRKNIHFRGHVTSASRIAQELKNADVFILASYRFDNQPIALTEAVSARLPILYCDDRLEVSVSENNSILTGPDVASLADGMRKISNPKVIKKLSEGSSKLSREISATSTAKQYEKIYKQLIKDKKSL